MNERREERGGLVVAKHAKSCRENRDSGGRGFSTRESQRAPETRDERLYTPGI